MTMAKNSESENVGRRGVKRRHEYKGISTRKYYDSSSEDYIIPSIRMDKLVSLTQLAICHYNIKEGTTFDRVNVLQVVVSLSGLIDNRITFEAFSPLGVTSVFEARITEHFYIIEIKYVRMKDQHGSDVPPSNISQQSVFNKLSAKCLKDLAPYLSQCALAMYNKFTLHVKNDAAHDIPSLKVVKAVKLEAPTYLITFQASLQEERNNVETFETRIFVPTVFPTTTIEFKEIKMIKHN